MELFFIYFDCVSVPFALSKLENNVYDAIVIIIKKMVTFYPIFNVVKNSVPHGCLAWYVCLYIYFMVCFN